MSKLRANLLLLLTAALWGFGNVAQKTVLQHLDPMSAVALRCLIGAALLLPFVAWRRPAGSDLRTYIVSLLRFGVPFALALSIQQIAYLGTSVTNASFLINTATVITPIVAWVMLRERPTLAVTAAGILALVGVLLLSGGALTGLGAGDWFALASAVLFAIWMVELGRHLTRYADPVNAAASQFVLAALIALPFGMSSGMLTFDAVFAAGPELAILGVFSTAIAFGVQTVAQRFTTSSHAAVIVSAESLFGAAAAALVLSERVTILQGVGGLLVLGAIVLLARQPASTTRATSATTPLEQPC